MVDKNVRFERLASVLWFLQNVLYYLLVMPPKICTLMDGYRETNNNLKSDIPKKKKRDPEGSRLD